MLPQSIIIGMMATNKLCHIRSCLFSRLGLRCNCLSVMPARSLTLSLSLSLSLSEGLCVLLCASSQSPSQVKILVFVLAYLHWLFVTSLARAYLPWGL